MSRRTPQRSRARQMLTMVPTAVPTGCGFESRPGERTGVTGRDGAPAPTHCPTGRAMRSPGKASPIPYPELAASAPSPGVPVWKSQLPASGDAWHRVVPPTLPSRDQTRHGGLHTTLVREQLWEAPRLTGQRCKVGTLQVTPVAGGSRTSALEERLPHRSSWHSCLPRWARCARSSHSTRHRPS